jgi:hypothetical protein
MATSVPVAVTPAGDNTLSAPNVPVRDTRRALTRHLAPSYPCHTTMPSPSSSSAILGLRTAPDDETVIVEPQAPR